jgi:NADH-ubiquinone oxidoreductase chain 4
VSPGLFIIVGGILYSRYHTRIITYYRGIITYMPILGTLFLILTLFNIAVPISGNFVGELLSLSGSFSYNPIMTGISCVSIVINAVYGI